MSQLEIKASILDNRILSFKLSDRFFESQKITCFTRESEASGMVKKILDESDVDEVCLGPREVRVKLSQDLSQWKGFAKKIGQIIRLDFDNQKNFFQKAMENEESQSLSSEDGLNAKVQELIEEKINPALAAHGGSVEVAKIEDFVVHLNFKGGCQGCSQVSVTVKSGIERMLKDQIPEIKGVKDVTAHEEGTNPYFM